eukprot:878629_1
MHNILIRQTDTLTNSSQGTATEFLTNCNIIHSEKKQLRYILFTLCTSNIKPLIKHHINHYIKHPSMKYNNHMYNVLYRQSFKPAEYLLSSDMPFTYERKKRTTAI